jgi:ketosteroid isomerase-like protein
MKPRLARLPLMALLAAGVVAQEPIPDALKSMADAERAFAKAATEKGVRDAFLEFFADDSIALRPKPVPAKDGLRKQPARSFSEHGIIWEPRTGDVAASGEIGWLTGPATFTKGPDAKPTGYGCYLSVWRLQPDGRWRVFIDIGTDAPEAVAFAPGLTRTSLERPYRGKASKESATASLSVAEHMLNQQIAAAGAKKAYAGLLTPVSRFHRPGRAPLVGASSITSFLEADRPVTTETGSAEAALSGELGYSFGTYEKKDKHETGPYVRLWSRDESGRWWLMAEVAHPVRAS